MNDVRILQLTSVSHLRLRSNTYSSHSRLYFLQARPNDLTSFDAKVVSVETSKAETETTFIVEREMSA
jgi:hypothetical protein